MVLQPALKNNKCMDTTGCVAKIPFAGTGYPLQGYGVRECNPIHKMWELTSADGTALRNPSMNCRPRFMLETAIQPRKHTDEQRGMCSARVTRKVRHCGAELG